MERPLAGRSILVVEDEPLIAMHITQTFEAAGAHVVTARTLREAICLAETDGLSAVVLDHALGDGESSKLCSRLKEREIPFVLYSGFADLEGAYEGALLVPKPADPAVLVTTVEAVLRLPPISN
jgi:DNA-binding response OmpR family regulator